LAASVTTTSPNPSIARASVAGSPDEHSRLLEERLQAIEIARGDFRLELVEDLLSGELPGIAMSQCFHNAAVASDAV
jgi:hypothetical protein